MNDLDERFLLSGSVESAILSYKVKERRYGSLLKPQDDKQ